MSSNNETMAQVISIKNVNSVPTLTIQESGQDFSSLMNFPFSDNGILYWDADTGKICSSTVTIDKLEAVLNSVQVNGEAFVIAKNVTALSYNAVDLV